MELDPSLTKNLETRELFGPLLNGFIEKSIAEHYAKSTDTSPITYAMFYEKFVKAVYDRNMDYVFSHCRSPIEIVFLNSLLLLFIKSGFTCLHLTAPATDIEDAILNRRERFDDITSLIESYKKHTGDNELSDFEDALQKRMKAGVFTEDEVEDILMHHSIVKNFEWNSFHVTPQAGFPHFKIKGKSIRVDLFIWIPSNPLVKIIVECDGFQFHSSKESFENDRARDRLFQMHGYKVIRFSGTEINREPAKVSSELFDLIEKIAVDHNVDLIL